MLESGERILGRAVVSNADPKRLLAMLPDAPAAFADRVAAWRTDSPVVKLNALLGRLPYRGPPRPRASARSGR